MKKQKCTARFRVRPFAVEVEDHFSLRFVWSQLKSAHLTHWVQEFVVKQPLTKTELRRLPKMLRERLA